MAAGLPKAPSAENVSSTLAAGISDSATSFDVSSASNFTSPGYYVIDRVDSSGALKATSLWEYIKVTNIASNTLTVTRGQGGSTQQSHSSGALIEAVVTASHFAEWFGALDPEHTLAGGHVITGTMTIAGMNMASVATIASAGIGTLRVVTSLNVSGASLSGIPIVPVFAFVGNLSGPTTLVQTPLVMPRSGRWQFANFWTRTVASGVSAIVDLNLNGGSIFEAVGRPMIAAGGTFVSTASINTKNFFRGDRLSWDYDSTNGHITDLDIMLVSE